MSRIPPRVLRNLIAPSAGRQSIARIRSELRREPDPPATAGPLAQLDAAERLLAVWPRRILPRVGSLLIAGVGSFGLAMRLLGDLATRDELDAVRRALPNNPTTEMDLGLWRLAHAARGDPPSAAALRDQTPEELAKEYAAGRLPRVLQRGLQAFLAEYGHRAVAEIDLGLPRWSEDPTPLLAHLVNYLQLDVEAPSPETQFAAAAAQAERTVETLARRAGRRGPVVLFLLRRGRALAGFREMPKFLVVLLLARARRLLLRVGEALAQQGRLSRADDVFFLTFGEARRAINGEPVQSLVDERRARYAEEVRRKHVPRILLSDGSEPRPADELPGDGDVLRGTPASAGSAMGKARVILDPAGARLQPGEILVAPSTDPGWTPLFLTAAGLVMEMGGAMSHGAVVAREYGIPAVVGVPEATQRIADGETIRIDGSSGIVSRRF
jgi:pyruvate,water dikinase